MCSRVNRVISNAAQLKALASPVRQELIDLLARTGPASAAELGRLVQRPADGLYYHLRELQRVGLVLSAGTRERAGRREEFFRAIHREPTLRHDPSPGGNTPAVIPIVTSMLRLGIRDFKKGAASPKVRTQGPRRELWAIRVTGWLSPAQLAEANQRIRALRDVADRRGPKGKLYAITILLAPLGHRARKRQQRSRSSRRVKAQ
jgi:DNA-binding transcriptional ArsR family regulator